ncbi:MAG: hypothetical protein M0P49_04470 [Bacilli bacterium]|nr:hypothetical protein [Bacilli bacterium]
MLENNIVKLERHIPANGKNPNTDYQIVGLEDAISKAIENGPLKLYFLSQITDIIPFLEDQEGNKLNENDVIGEIVSFDDTTISFKPLHQFTEDDFSKYDIRFVYDVNRIHEKEIMKVTSIVVVYIQKESDEEWEAWLDEKEKEENEELELALAEKEKEETDILSVDNITHIELHDNIKPEDDAILKKE